MEMFAGIIMVTTALAILIRVVVAFHYKPRVRTQEQNNFAPQPRSTRVEFGKRKSQGMS
jgi:hypothetical protein